MKEMVKYGPAGKLLEKPRSLACKILLDKYDLKLIPSDLNLVEAKEGKNYKSFHFKDDGMNYFISVSFHYNEFNEAIIDDSSVYIGYRPVEEIANKIMHN
jgi:hypothetical protein